MKESLKNAFFLNAWESASSDARPRLVGQAGYNENCERVKKIRAGILPCASNSEMKVFISELLKIVSTVLDTNAPYRSIDVLWVSATKCTPLERYKYVAAGKCGSHYYDSLCHLYLAAPDLGEEILR